MDIRFPRTQVNPMDEDELFPAIREENLRRHVMDAPESAHQVEELISRGIRDPEVILTTLKDLQSSEVPVPLNDGIL
jgi:predicted RNA-binding protein associated with RNAse of E/G family